MMFAVGDHVRKTKGEYRYDGIVVAAFKKIDGAERYVVENADGMLFIFNDRQLEGEPRKPPPRDRFEDKTVSDLEPERRAFLQNNPPSG